MTQRTFNNPLKKLLIQKIKSFSKTFENEGWEDLHVKSKIHWTILNFTHFHSFHKYWWITSPAPCSKSRLEFALPGEGTVRQQWVPCQVRPSMAHASGWKCLSWNPPPILGYPGAEHGYWPVCVSQDAGPSFTSACARNLSNQWMHTRQEFQAVFCCFFNSSVTVAHSSWIWSARRELQELKLIKIMAFNTRIDRETVSVLRAISLRTPLC